MTQFKLDGKELDDYFNNKLEMIIADCDNIINQKKNDVEHMIKFIENNKNNDKYEMGVIYKTYLENRIKLQQTKKLLCVMIIKMIELKRTNEVLPKIMTKCDELLNDGIELVHNLVEIDAIKEQNYLVACSEFSSQRKNIKIVYDIGNMLNNAYITVN